MNQEIQFCLAPDNVTIAYATMGQGPVLVKVANWMSHLEYDWQSPVWQPWLAALSQHHTLIRYDKRGCGLSDRDLANQSFEAWVQDLETVIEAAGLERFPLFGMSQGGLIAMAYAARHPEKVSHLILYGTYLQGRLKRNPSEQDREEVAMLLKLIELGWGRENPAFRQVFTTQFLPEADQAQVQWFNHLQRISTAPATAVSIVKTLNELDVRASAASLTTPTLVLHASGDALVPFEQGRLTAAYIPGARFVPLASQNHILLQSEPAWSDFLTEVYRFLGVTAPPTQAAPSAHPKTNWNLTVREQEVLQLLAQGYQNPEIAKTLVLSPKTIRNYVSNIFGKLHVTSRGEAIVLAREAGFGEERK